MTVINFPIGPSEVLALSATGVQALTVNKSYTIVDGVTVEGDTGDRTLNLTIDADMPIGAQLFVMAKTASTETTIFGTGITGVTITGVAGKTINALFIYDGTTFVQAGAEQQID